MAYSVLYSPVGAWWEIKCKDNAFSTTSGSFHDYQISMVVMFVHIYTVLHPLHGKISEQLDSSTRIILERNK